MLNRIIAQTENVTIEERQHNNKYYVVFIADTGNSKFYTKHSAFEFAYQELKSLKATDYYNQHMTW